VSLLSYSPSVWYFNWICGRGLDIILITPSDMGSFVFDGWVLFRSVTLFFSIRRECGDGLFSRTLTGSF